MSGPSISPGQTNILMTPFTFLSKETVSSISDKNLTDLAIKIKRVPDSSGPDKLYIVTAPNNLFGKIVRFIFGAKEGRSISKIKENLTSQYGMEITKSIFAEGYFQQLERNDGNLSVAHIKKIYDLASMLSQDKEAETASIVSAASTENLTASSYISTPRQRSHSEPLPQHKRNTAVPSREHSNSIESAVSDDSSLSSLSQSTQLSQNKEATAAAKTAPTFSETAPIASVASTQELPHNETQNNISTPRKRSHSEAQEQDHVDSLKRARLADPEIDDDDDHFEHSVPLIERKRNNLRNEPDLKDFHSPDLFPKESAPELVSNESQNNTGSESNDDLPSLEKITADLFKEHPLKPLLTIEDDLLEELPTDLYNQRHFRPIDPSLSDQISESPSDATPRVDTTPEPVVAASDSSSIKPSEKKPGKVADLLAAKKEKTFQEQIAETKLRHVTAPPDPAKEKIIAGLKGSYQEFFDKLKKLQKEIVECQKEIQKKRATRDNDLKNPELSGKPIHVENADAVKALEQQHQKLVDEQRSLQAEQEGIVAKLKENRVLFDELGKMLG